MTPDIATSKTCGTEMNPTPSPSADCRNNACDARCCVAIMYLTKQPQDIAGAGQADASKSEVSFRDFNCLQKLLLSNCAKIGETMNWDKFFDSFAPLIREEIGLVDLNPGDER
jgi:hypothetical protein